MKRAQVKACLITNPRSGKGRIDLTAALSVLHAHGWETRVREKRHGGEATDLARWAADNEFDVVLACAGDGTVSEIVDGLAGTDLAVGVLPAGTANLWAHEIGVSSRLEVAARQMIGAERRSVDLGHVTVNGRHGQHFLLMAGLGLDGAVISQLSKPLKRRIGKFAVGLAALRVLPRYRAEQVYASIDGLNWHGMVTEVLVGNTRRYGGFTRITPDAYIDDGLLDLWLLGPTGPINAARQVASLLFRQRPSTASAESYRAAALYLEAPRVLALQIDGGAVRLKKVKPKAGTVDYSFTTVAGAVTMLVPAGGGETLFQHDALMASRRGEVRSSGLLRHHPDTLDGAHCDDEAERYYEVIGVGADSLTVVHNESGAVMRVKVGTDTIVEPVERHQPSGSRTQSISPLLTGIQPGDALLLKGKKQVDAMSVNARRLTLLPSGKRGEQSRWRVRL